jgi:cytochrome c oxidase subunit 2
MKVALNRNLLAAAACLIARVFASVADAERGEQLFQLCSQCHGVDGGGNQIALAPSIAGLDLWYVQRQLEKFRSGIRGAHPGDISGLRMHPMALQLVKDEDPEAVAAYVASMPVVKPEPTLEGGDAARGSELFKVCATCHGADGKGNEQLFGPPLNHASDWYLFAQLEKFRSGVRGADPRDQQGALMRPMAISLPDEQAMKDAIAHIMTLAR